MVGIKNYLKVVLTKGDSLLKGAKELAKKEGMTGGEAIFLMNTTSGKVLFDIADRQKLDETLVKVTGDVIQGVLLKYIPVVGWAIDLGLYASGNSLGDLFLDTYVGIKGTSFSQGYIYVPNGTGITVSGVGPFGIGESYFRVTTITENGRTRIATDTDGHYIGAEVIGKSMYESVHPDYNDLRKAKIDTLNKIDSITSGFNPDHLVEFENGVLKVTFPDGHIEAEDLEGGNNDIMGGDKNDTLVGNAGSDTLDGGTGTDTLHGGADNDVLLGGNDTDYLYGDAGGDTLLGGDDDATDILVGGSGEDVLLGQGGDDIMIGGNSLTDLYSEKEYDYLSGGRGFDTYYVSNQDYIADIDYSGLIMFNDKSLSGKKTKIDDATYEDDNFVYALNGSNMVVVEKATQEYITIENFNFNSVGFGIDFSESDPDKQDIELTVSDATTIEGGDLVFGVSINHALKYDLKVNVNSYFNANASIDDVKAPIGGTVTIQAGETSTDFTIKTVDDHDEEPTEKFLFAATGYKYLGENKPDNDLGSLLIMNAVDGTIKDNDEATLEPLQIEISDAVLSEDGGSMEFTISLKGTLQEGKTLTVNLTTQDGSATGGDDYAGLSGSVVFDGTSDTQTFSVHIIDDDIKEPTERFELIVTDIQTDSDQEITSVDGEGTIFDNDDNGKIAIDISSTFAAEGDSGIQSTSVVVSLSHTLTQDITIDLSSGDSVTIPAGYGSATAQVAWGSDVVDTIVDSDAPIEVNVTDFYYFGDEEIVIGDSGEVEIWDDDDGDGHGFDDKDFTPLKRDPLVLDTDKDGFISTIALKDSNAYFDLTGDGVKERVGWIESNDGILVYDKNNNGNIDGIDEVFGNTTTSGFSELKQIADSNNDNKIDRRDELYNRLQVWHDHNQNGSVDTGELSSLKEEGVKSIELDVVGTNIDINGNLITEAGRYQDSEGNRELAADVELAFDSRITAVDISQIPDYQEHPEAATLPNLRGYGVVIDASVAYNVDDDFRALALTYASDIEKSTNEFEKFLDSWSGVDKLEQELQEKYSLEQTPQMNSLDKKVWSYEHFMGRGSFSAGIEARLEATAKAMSEGSTDTTSASTRYNTAVVESAYDSLLQRYRSFFILQTYYKDVLGESVSYSRAKDEFVVNDVATFTDNITNYLNDTTNPLDDKLGLLKNINDLKGTFLTFDADAIIANVTDDTLQTLTAKLLQENANLDIYNADETHTKSNTIIVGSSEADTIQSNGANATIIAGKGDDAIVSSSGNDTLFYKRGDGNDIVFDKGGVDTFNFSDVNRDDTTLSKKGDDLVVQINDTNEEITFVNYFLKNNRIENINFADGSKLDYTQIIQDLLVGDGDDTLELTNTDDIIEALGGNDIYIYNLGDGSDTIIDASGNDTLQLGSGITQDMLIAKRVGSDMVIGFKEDGKSFDELSTKIILKNNTVENIKLDDGTSVSMVDIQGNGVKFTKSNTSNLYHKVINNIYENKNKQDIIVDIFKRIA